MINLILTLALAQPCVAPAPIKHHKHAKPVPVQSCVTPPVPMCFREPTPDPTEVILPPLQTYPTTADTVPATDTLPGEPTMFLGYGGGGITGYSAAPPPRTVTPRYPTLPVARAPEISGAAATGALTLLLGFCAILGGRPRE